MHPVIGLNQQMPAFAAESEPLHGVDEIVRFAHGGQALHFPKLHIARCIAGDQPRSAHAEGKRRCSSAHSDRVRRFRRFHPGQEDVAVLVPDAEQTGVVIDRDRHHASADGHLAHQFAVRSLPNPRGEFGTACQPPAIAADGHDMDRTLGMAHERRSGRPGVKFPCPDQAVASAAGNYISGGIDGDACDAALMPDEVDSRIGGIGNDRLIFSNHTDVAIQKSQHGDPPRRIQTDRRQFGFRDLRRPGIGQMPELKQLFVVCEQAAAIRRQPSPDRRSLLTHPEAHGCRQARKFANHYLTGQRLVGHPRGVGGNAHALRSAGLSKVDPLGRSGCRPVQMPNEQVADIVDGQQQVPGRGGHQAYRITLVG